MAVKAIMECKPSQVKMIVRSMIRARQNVMLVGAPGIGKSDIMRQAADEEQCESMTLHPAVSDPTDYKGMPFPGVDRKSADFLPYGELYRMIHADKPTLVNAEELGQAPPGVQAALMHLLLAREVAGKKISPHVTFAACTNRREDRAGVVGILEPVKSRFGAILHMVPDYDEWKMGYAYPNKVHESIIAFLGFRPDMFFKHNPTADIVNSPNPRTWVNLSKLVYLELSADVAPIAYEGAVGAVAGEYLSYLKHYSTRPNIDAILENPEKGEIPKEKAVLYAVAVGLAARASKENFDAVVKYAWKLHDAGKGEYTSLIIIDSIRKDVDLVSNQMLDKLSETSWGKTIIKSRTA